jgi:hypothetical protein
MVCHESKVGSQLGADSQTKPFMLAGAICGTLPAEHGSTPESAQCLGILLDLVPEDANGTVYQFKKAGLVHECFGSEAPGKQM